MSRFIPFHTKRCAIAFWVGLTPECESPWILSNTVRVQEVGSTGLGGPMEVSQSSFEEPILISWTGSRPVVAVRYDAIPSDFS